MLKTASIGVLALLAASLLATSVEAHPTLKSSIPPAESTAAAPKEIRLNFSEGMIVKFSTVELKHQGGKKIATGKLSTDGPEGPEAAHRAATGPVARGHLHGDVERGFGRYAPC